LFTRLYENDLRAKMFRWNSRLRWKFIFLYEKD